MEIYLITWFVVPLSIYLFIYHPQKLFYATVFSIPFTATSIFNITLAVFKVGGIKVSMFLGFLCILRYLISIVAKNSIRIVRRDRIILCTLALLVLVILLTSLMPLYISGDLKVLDTYGEGLVMYAKEIALYPKAQYLTQTAYFIFGCLIVYLVYFKVQLLDIYIKVIKIYLVSSAFVCVWGWFEILCYYLDFSYPAFLFNQNQSEGYHILLMYELIPRISSAALEPSVLAQQLITALPILIWANYYRVYFFSKVNDLILTSLIILTLIFCISSTAYVGLAAMTFVYILELNRRKKVKLFAVIFQFVLLILAVILLPFLFQNVVEKLNSFSGVERFKAIYYASSYFAQYPLLGIGWGVFPAWDFVLCILAGGGIITLIIFLFLLALTFKRFNITNKFPLNLNYKGLRLGISYSLILLLLVSQVSGFIYYSQYFWFILGLAIAFPRTIHNEQSNNK